MKVALIVGHNFKSKGAFSKIVGSEYDYWKNVAEKIKAKMPDVVDIYLRYPNVGYASEMKEMVSRLNKSNYEFCIELHFNAGTQFSNGSECLIYKKNIKAENLAKKFLSTLHTLFYTRNRGIIKIKDPKERGGYGICYSKDTYILIEPFFGSNETEATRFSDVGKVVDLFVNFIKENI